MKSFIRCASAIEPVRQEFLVPFLRSAKRRVGRNTLTGQRILILLVDNID